MKKQLSHLTERQIEDVIIRYYSGERIRDIINEYNIDVRPSSLVSLFPPQIHEDLICQYCKSVNLETKRKSRSAGSWNVSVPSCPSCGHKQITNCHCSGCMESKKAKVNKINEIKRDIIYEEYANENLVCESIEYISLRDAVYLLSIVKHSASEDLNFVDPFNANDPVLAPTFELQSLIVRHLYSKNFIQIDPNSDIDAFVFNEKISNIEAYYPTKISWKLLPNIDIQEKNKYLRNIRKIVESG